MVLRRVSSETAIVTFVLAGLFLVGSVVTALGFIQIISDAGPLTTVHDWVWVVSTATIFAFWIIVCWACATHLTAPYVRGYKDEIVAPAAKLATVIQSGRRSPIRSEVHKVGLNNGGDHQWVLAVECRGCGRMFQHRAADPPVTNDDLANPSVLVTGGECPDCDAPITESRRWHRTPSPVVGIGLWFRRRKYEVGAIWKAIRTP